MVRAYGVGCFIYSFSLVIPRTIISEWHTAPRFSVIPKNIGSLLSALKRA